MPVEVVTHAHWTWFAKACKVAGSGKGLMREVRGEIREAAKPAVQAVKAAAPKYMPDNYAAEMTGSLKAIVSATVAGVTVRGRAKTRRGKARVLRRLEQGVLRHPLWGRWIKGKFLQNVRAGFWSEPLLEQADEIRAAIRRAMDEVARKIAAG